MAKQKENTQDQNSINIDLPEDIAEGIFVNQAMIIHGATEFVIDFIRMMPGMPSGKVKSRVVLTPEHAVRLLEALNENIRKYEDVFGPIKLNEGPNGSSFPVGFGGQMGEA